MEDLLSRLKAGKALVHSVSLNQVQVHLKLLTEQDYMQAGLDVLAYFEQRRIGFSTASAELFEAEKATQLLLLALVDAAGNPLPISADQLRKTLSRNEKFYLVEQYLELEKRYSPSERTLSEDEFSTLLDTVKKTPQTSNLNDLSFDTLKKLITTLASPPAN